MKRFWTNMIKQSTSIPPSLPRMCTKYQCWCVASDDSNPVISWAYTLPHTLRHCLTVSDDYRTNNFHFTKPMLFIYRKVWLPHHQMWWADVDRMFDNASNWCERRKCWVTFDAFKVNTFLGVSFHTTTTHHIVLVSDYQEVLGVIIISQDKKVHSHPLSASSFSSSCIGKDENTERYLHPP